MPYAVLRFETRARVDMDLADHVRSMSRPESADTDRTRFNIQSSKAQLGKALDALNGALDRRARRSDRRGARAKHCVDFLMAGPPPHTDTDTWSAKRVRRWASTSMAWLKETFPHAVEAFSALHVDENSPHVHATLIPIARDGRLSWKQLRFEATGVENHHEQARRLHDSYASYMQEHGFNLERGVRGGPAVHTDLDTETRIERRVQREVAKRLPQEPLVQRMERVVAEIEMLKADLAQHRKAYRGQATPETRAQSKEYRGRIRELSELAIELADGR